ncbi:DUF4190 domain-containing protein [Nocardia sp. XZ_19_385]|uniref:DUF4190 domain-containing protein n=1 Tax=Nocardia sp. XZ_19_385 TaxID=2769488 RepID=UPI0028161D5B|nr:DUF4190 domain-containing protein [Nocardia sp. XZ_19_385]
MNAYPEPYYGYPPYVRPPDHPQATTAMALGIVALLSYVACPLLVVLGPVAWVMGKRAMDEIDASGGALGGRGNAQAGYVCGIIATVLLSLAVAFFLTMFIAVGISL